MAVDKFIEFLLFEKNYSQHTVTAYINDIGFFDSFLANEFEDENLLKSCCVKSQTNNEMLKQQIENLTTQNNTLQNEYGNSFNIVKHLERSLILLKQDILKPIGV